MSQQRIKFQYRVIDERAGQDQPPLLMVSIHHGVVRRDTLTDDLPRAEDLSNYKLCEPGDIVLNRMRAFQGAIGISPQRGLVSPDYLVLRPGPDVDARYLHHLFRSTWFVGEMASRLRGIGNTENGAVRTPRINPEDLGDIAVRFPSLNEQHQIADFLDIETARIDALIAAKSRQADALEQRRAVFERTAIAGGFHAMTTDSGIPWIGKVDLRAEIVPLQRITLLQRGVDLTEEQRRPGNIPVVTTAGISGFHDQSVAPGPGVVVGRYGSAGSVHWIEQSYWPHNTTLYVKNFNGNLPKYCFYVLRNLPYEMEQARSAVPGINRNDIHKRMMPLLPLQQQGDVVTEIDSYVAHTNASVAAISKGIDLLAERRQALISAAVTGQIDVTTARQPHLPSPGSASA
ncbi:restriction endonuclease subunit S [Streptomyces canus]|uniref:restriction endonuclease subunit S n=1 Tax=Streptomyces canus TaxID=58343 RepID=UPI0033AED237